MTQELTAKQRQCIYFLAQGYSEQEVADKVGIKVDTIRDWMTNNPNFVVELESRQRNPSPNTLAPTSTPSITIPNKRNRWRKVLIGAVIGLCILSSICAFVVLKFGSTLSNEGAAITEQIDLFMGTMVQRDVEGAYELFSAFARERFPKSALTEMIEGANYALFDQYQRVELGPFQIMNNLSTNRDRPNGVVATAKGVVHYANGFEGSFTASLHKENEQWKLLSINVTVTPAKLEKYLEER